MRHTHHAEQWLPYPVANVFDFFADPENLPRLMPEWQKARIEQATIALTPWRPGTGPDPDLAGLASQTPSASRPPAESKPTAAGKGTRMTITFLPFPHAPFRVPWDAEITEFEWDNHFCDVQHRGPFALWKHCHYLKSQLRGVLEGTLLTDRVEYELPLGVVGDLANRLFVKGQMDAIFLYRQKRTAELLPLSLPQRSGTEG